MAKALIVGNWKAYVTSLKDAKKLLKDIERGLSKTLKAEVVVCPPNAFLGVLRSTYGGKRISFGAQDAFYENGAHTGETTTSMLRDLKISYVIVGHAERRARGETDEIVAKKVGAVLDAKLTPLMCVGETERDKDGHYLALLEKSILDSLALVDEVALKKVVIAYEPVWAIGAPLPPSARTIRETIIFIRKTLAQKYSREVALKVKILYGGAVSAETAPDLIENSSAQGFLLGRASVDAFAFSSILSAWNK